MGPGYYVLHGDYPNQLVPVPFISMRDAELHPLELRAIQEGEFDTDRMIYLVQNFGLAEGADEEAAVKAVEEVRDAVVPSPERDQGESEVRR